MEPKRHVTVYIEAEILLAFQVGCRRRRVAVSEEVQRLMLVQAVAWNELPEWQPALLQKD